MKSVHIRNYSGSHFPAFGLNTERERDTVSLRIQSECGKMQARITPNTETFYAVTLRTIPLVSAQLSSNCPLITKPFKISERLEIRP